jgi:manganese/zinc/iron transport system permease protein
MNHFLPPFDFEQHVLALWRLDADVWAQSSQADTVWTIALGALVAISCGWIGCWMILQGMALLGDAISHTVLLGIVVAFLITGQVTGPVVLLAAVTTGILTTGLIEAVRSTSRVKEDAAIGIVFTSLFALGVVLLSTFASKAHIDVQHVLYGNLEFVALSEKMVVGPLVVPAAVGRMALVFVGVGALILLFYKELLVVAFDPLLAASLGLRPALVRHMLLGTLSLAVVSSFSAVGAILVVAMLIAPAATAYLLTPRLPRMFAISALVGILSSVIGYHISNWLAVSGAGAMVCVACGCFSLAFVLGPSHGLAPTWFRRTRLQWRMVEENIVRQLLKLSDGLEAVSVSRRAVVHALSISRWRFAVGLLMLRARRWVQIDHADRRSLRLTSSGLDKARLLDRAHRLWETFLVGELGLPSDQVHPTAEELEHLLDERLIERLDDALGHPSVDPHGSPIPRSPVPDRAPGVFTLSKLRVGDSGRVVGLVEPAGGTPKSSVSIASLGITLDARIRLIAHEPAEPVWTIELAGGRRIAVSHEAADRILVQVF